ncbi:conserved hypothetical protein [Aspergillus terreus NIH2624]|uniref:MOSC domain-containing protein n=1 Tax=Aspergillus terreus (strain NIH 2624 / FGSC A1156) TaxID=341663 RepID=Q0CIY9_ASPTN|nr:uncharacterized protein ATEG_06345 [Aspergillus terreus NIH2624]EAU32889.1 conserved hypothetical protein [Aspergillus terreus NIH2624]
MFNSSIPFHLSLPVISIPHVNVSFPPAIYWLSILPVAILLLQFHRPQVRPQGCRKLGLSPAQSNLRDEYDPKYTQGVPSTQRDEQGRPAWRIKALFTFPIKSCAEVELDVADVVATGLAHDRQFCFAEYITPSPSPSSQPSQQQQPYWTARTMRDGEFSKLALIRPEIWVPDPTAPDYAPDLDEVRSHGVLIVHYPRVPRNTLHALLLRCAASLHLLPTELSFTVPLIPPSPTRYPSTAVKIWKDIPLAWDYGEHLPPSLRAFLTANSGGRTRGPITLFRAHPAHPREIFRCAPRKEDVGFQPVTAFADAYPLHLLNLASVRDVARRCVGDIPRLSVRRFRANVLVQGPPAFAEDAWKRIRVCGPAVVGTGEGLEIYASCRTMRCKLPNVDPDTGVRHPAEPDRTLKSYRRIDPGDYSNAALGMQLVPVAREFTLRVGDAVEVLETGEHFYIKMLAPGEKVEGV